VTSLRILGVIVNDKLTAADHVTMLLSSCGRMLYAMRVLCARVTPATSLHDIFQYAVPAWSGGMRHGRLDTSRRPWMRSATDRARLD